MADKGRRDDALETLGVLVLTHCAAFVAGAVVCAVVVALFF